MSDIDQRDFLTFTPPGHRGACVVHRRAFRVLLRGCASLEDCERFLAHHRGAFDRAALDKKTRARLGPDARFHINSRDIRRALSGLELGSAESAQEIAGQGSEERP